MMRSHSAVLILLHFLLYSLVGAAKWGFDDATVSVHGKKAGVGGGVKEK